MEATILYWGYIGFCLSASSRADGQWVEQYRWGLQRKPWRSSAAFNTKVSKVRGAGKRIDESASAKAEVSTKLLFSRAWKLPLKVLEGYFPPRGAIQRSAT